MNEIIKIKVVICEVESKCRMEKKQRQSCLLLSNKIDNQKRAWSSWKKREREGHLCHRDGDRDHQLVKIRSKQHCYRSYQCQKDNDLTQICLTA